MASNAMENIHIVNSEYRMCLPISRFARPSASHSAGENGLIKVPMIFPIISA